MINPEVYRYLNIVREHTTNILEEFEDVLVKVNGQCMDIGCGPGDVTKEILLPCLAPTSTILGTDISEDMISFANREYADSEQLRFETLNIQTKNLPEKYISQFNHVFSFHALNWCSDIRQTFENIYRMLRPGGTMLILTIHNHDIFHVLHDMTFDDCFTKYIRHEKKFLPPFYNSPKPRKDVTNLLRDIGFVVHHCSHRERTYKIDDVNSYTNMIMSFIPVFFHDMPDDIMNKFADRLTLKFARKKSMFRDASHLINKKAITDVHEILIIYAQKKMDCNLIVN